MTTMRSQRKMFNFKKSKPKKKSNFQKKTNQRLNMLEKTIDWDTIFSDTDNSDAFTTPLVIPIGLQGATTKEYLLRRIHMKGIIEHKVVTSDTVLTRIVIVRDKLNSSAVATTWLEVFRENEVFSHRANDVSTDMPDRRFTIVYDRVFKTENDADATRNTALSFNFSKNYKNMEQHQIDDIGEQNGFYLMMISTAVSGIVDVSTSIAFVQSQVDS